LKMLGRK